MKCSLKNYINRCRCCLEAFHDEEVITPITDFFEIQFYAFTSITLLSNELLSKHVCEFCHTELMRFSVFKKDLIEKQQRLYDLLNAKKGDGEIQPESHEEISSSDELMINEDVTDASESETVDDESSYDSENYSDEDFDVPISRNNKGLENSPRPRGKFMCDHCNLTFKAKQGLTRHVQTHFGKCVYNWPCNQCDYRGSSKNKLRIHKTRNHKVENLLVASNGHVNRYKCFCGSAFAQLSSLRGHKTRRHGDIKSCNYGCHIDFDTIGEWIRHIRENHSKYEKECLLMVTASKNNKWYTDTFVDQSDNEAIEGSLKQESDDDEKGKLECHECFKLFSTSQSLRLHVETIHREIRKFKCNECNALFKQHVHLQEHLLSVHKIKPYSCSFCKFTCQYLTTLKQHESEHKNNEEESKSSLVQSLSITQQQHSCACGRKYTFIRRLTTHQKSCPAAKLKKLQEEEKKKKPNNPRNKPSSCWKCHKLFASYSNLIRHQKTNQHLDQEQLENLKFECNICGKRFFSEKNMMCHKYKSHSKK